MEPGNLDTLIDMVKTIAHGRHADLLQKFINLLYEKEMEEPEYFSPEDEAAIAEGKAQIARGETIPWDDLKKELNL